MEKVRVFIKGIAVVLVSLTAKGQSTSINIPVSLTAFVDSAVGQNVERIQKIQQKYRASLNKVTVQLLKQERKAKELLDRIDNDPPITLELPQSIVGGGVSYIPFLDSLSMAFQFAKKASIVTGNSGYIKAITDVKKEFEAAEKIEAEIRNRIAKIKMRLLANEKLKVAKKLSQSLDMYANELQSYKAALNKPDILARKAFEQLSKSKYFKDFFSRNSELSKYFLIPGHSDNLQVATVEGLQTNLSLEHIVSSRIGLSGQALKQQIQAPSPNVEQVIAQLKHTLSKSTNNQSEVVVPDYKPAATGRRTIWNRLEYGVNIQGQKANIFPATIDIAVTLGYLINDKSIIGIGASYRLGLGEVFKNIEVSHQGVGFRSFVDLKIKGSVFVSGGFELNQTGMSTVSAVPYVYNDWQHSGLLGISRKFKVGNYAKSQVQILWDFLSYTQVPRAQPFLFRVGYSFNK